MLDDHFGQVHIQTLAPLRVAAYRAISKTPEDDAFKYMEKWIAQQNIKASQMRAFGFDMAVSASQKQEGLRGYEVWISVPPEVQPSAGVNIKDFAGGLYAVMKISDPFTDAFKTIPAGWTRLQRWVGESGRYWTAKYQWLEEHIQGEGGVYLDISLPIAPAGEKTEPKIVQRSAFLVAGLRYAGKNEHGEIPAMWDNDFLPRMGELASLRVGCDVYGVARALPNVPPEEGFEYLAAVEVKSFGDLPQGMVGWEIPALTYAVLPAHDVPDIGPTSKYFYRQWLPQSKEYKLGEGLMLEVYPETYPQDLIIYLHFPVRRK